MAETLNTFEEAAPNQEYEAEMLAKGEALETANNPERPEWLPEKFESAEAMAQAYADLERKLGNPSQDSPEEVQTESDDEPELNAEAEASDVAQALDNVGLNFDTFQQEYTETGELSDDAYNSLAE